MMWSEDEVPAADEYIDRTFGRGGYLARKWGESYQPRDGQIALARAVDDALCARTHLLSEAPTGTGKSLAYSVPATYHAATRGQVVVIVTANIALQEQLVAKDLPLLAEVLPWGFSFGLLKGRANYLCRARYESAHMDMSQQPLFGDGADMRNPDREKLRLMKWAEREVADRLAGLGGYGDQSSLDWKPSDKVWRELSVGPEDCRGKKCEFAKNDTCGALAAQRLARQSQVVVTNYHIFFANLRVYMQSQLDLVLPAFDAVIFDEAHKAADVAREFFGWEVTESAVRRSVSFFRDGEPALVEEVQHAAGWFFEQMLRLRRDRDRYKAHVVPARFSDHDVQAANTLLEKLATLAQKMENKPQADPGGAEMALGKMRKAMGIVSTILEGGADNDVIFIDEDEFRKAHVACRLVQPARMLRSALFEKTKNERVQTGDDGGGDSLFDSYDDSGGGGGTEVQIGPPVSVVCTSATLATEQSFDFTKSELGVTGCDEVVVDSPFDYESQALFIIPDVCDPNDIRFTSEVAAVFLRTIELARGRTLGLFTSRKRMNDVYDAISGRTPFRVMRQDDGQRTQLIEDFRKDTHSVLMGVASFWAGVDVPGESLSCVFIDKIPFPTPDDPVLGRLSETDKRAWAAYAVPRAIIEFKQGFGRLIRSSTDRGVVVCCDSRLVTKGYGKQFLRAMPKGMQKIRNLEAIREWLDGPGTAEEEVVDPFS